LDVKDGKDGGIMDGQGEGMCTHFKYPQAFTCLSTDLVIYSTTTTRKHFWRGRNKTFARHSEKI
jgi:hypothetical protein